VQTLLVQNAGFSLGQAIGLGAACSLVIVAVMVFLGPESKGRAFIAED
jgi:hypothetical protein